MSGYEQYLRRQIRLLQTELAQLGDKKRKEYHRQYYRDHRDEKLKAANERNRKLKTQEVLQKVMAYSPRDTAHDERPTTATAVTN